MKYKKMLLAFLVVLTILTIGLASVSAASSDNTDIAIASDSASGDEIVADTIDEKNLMGHCTSDVHERVYLHQTVSNAIRAIDCIKL